MKNARKIVQEIESSLKKAYLFMVVIKAMVLLSLSYIILFIIGLPPYYAFIPAFVYFISSLAVGLRIDNLRLVEDRYATINEKLKTARDYRYRENSILDTMEEELIADLKKVELSAFLSYKKAAALIIILLLAVSSSLYISSNEIKIIDFNDFVNDAVRQLNREENQTQEADFLGEETSIMQVGNEKLEVKINPVGIDFDFNNVQEAQNYEFSSSFPKDIFISSGASAGNEFTEEQQVLVKKYFEKKTQRGG